MRVTQSMISNNMLKNLNKSYGNMDKYMDQLNTGKRINKMSDDPVAGMNALGYRTELARVEQYQRNASDLHNWYDNTDAALEQVSSGLHRVRELAVLASNGTNTESELQAIAEEVKQIQADIVDVANTKVGDNYIFNGTFTNTPPIAENGEIDFQEGDFNITVSGEAELVANLDARKVFGFEEGQPAGQVGVATEEYTDMFSILQGFIDDLESDEEVADMGANLEKLDDVFDNVVNQRAELGARMNRLDLVENRLTQQEVVATEMVSRNEDVNYAEAITNLITQESIHRAALSSGARIIQPSLLDFLR